MSVTLDTMAHSVKRISMSVKVSSAQMMDHVKTLSIILHATV